MSELERRLRAFPGEFPRPSEEATLRGRSQLSPPRKRRPPRRRWSTAAVLAGAVASGLLVGAASLATATDSHRSAVDDPTIFARFFTEGPYKTRYMVLYGRVPNASGDDLVEILERTCGRREFRIATSARTTVAGFWELPARPFYDSVTYVARWKGRLSDELALRTGLYVIVFPMGQRRWRIQLASRYQEMRRRVVFLQRRVGEGQWTTIRRLRLQQGSAFGSYQVPFTFRQRGVTLRGLVPQTSARPCLDAEASTPFTT